MDQSVTNSDEEKAQVESYNNFMSKYDKAVWAMGLIGFALVFYCWLHLRFPPSGRSYGGMEVLYHAVFALLLHFIGFFAAFSIRRVSYFLIALNVLSPCWLVSMEFFGPWP